MFKTSEQTDFDSESTALKHLSGDISNLKTSLKSGNESTEAENFSKTDDVQVDVERQSTSFALVTDSHNDSANAYSDVTKVQKWGFQLDQCFVDNPKDLPQHLTFVVDRGSNFLFMVDTGCEVSIIPKSFVSKVEKTFPPYSRSIKGI